MPGPFDRFNDRAKRVLALAQDEAIRFNHNYIGAEHLLLGLVREGEGSAARTLDALGVKLSQVRLAVESKVGRGPAGASPSEITLAPVVKKIIDFAIEEARKLGHGHIGTEHLLLGIVREEQSVATKVLESLGVTLERVRHQLIATIGEPSAAQPGAYGTSDASAAQVIALATQEARDLGHDWLGSEHLLLGLLLTQGPHANALHSLGIRYGPVREAVIKMVPARDETPTTVSMTPRVQTILGYAQGFGDATGRGRNARTILLGLVAETAGIGALVLAGLGATPEKVRAALETHGERATVSAFSGGGYRGPFDRFNDRAKRVIALAQDEAIRMHHNYIGTEHLLLGFLRDEEGVAGRVLASLGVEITKVRTAVEFTIGRGDTTVSPSETTLSPRTKKVIELAIEEARKLGHPQVGTEHLLLGLVREGEGIASGVLESLGVSLEKVRHEVIATLGRLPPPT